MKELFDLRQFDPRKVRSEFLEFGASSAPLLTKKTCKELLDEFRRINIPVAFAGPNPYLGFERHAVFDPPEGLFQAFGVELSRFIGQSFGGEVKQGPNSDFHFTEYTPLRYLPGARLKPHYDSDFYKILICSVVVDGEGDFVTYPDPLDRTNKHLVKNEPGDIVFMVTQGFAGMSRNTFHEVTNIRKERLSVVYRYEF